MKYALFLVYVVFGGIALSVLHVASVNHKLLACIFVPLLTVFLTAPIWFILRPALRFSRFIIVPYVLFIGFCTLAEYVTELRGYIHVLVLVMTVWIWLVSRHLRTKEVIGPMHAISIAKLFFDPSADSEIFKTWAKAAAQVLGHQLGKGPLPFTEASLMDIELALKKPSLRDQLQETDPFTIKVNYIGAFIGEIMRKEMGGNWEYADDLDLWLMALNNGPKANPFEKAKKLLSEEGGESLVSFYKSGKALNGK